MYAAAFGSSDEASREVGLATSVCHSVGGCVCVSGEKKGWGWSEGGGVAGSGAGRNHPVHGGLFWMLFVPRCALD